jgi:16S rRNA (adenine1518-N6/adenine1519-N6)-dimethyltransferase
MKRNTLSQVFLHNENTLERISKAIGAEESDVVFEIGGGKGQLTKYLAVSGAKVFVCELDKKLIPYLRDLNAEIINENVLSVKIPMSVTLIVGNIPYHLSGKITEKVLKEGKRCVILYQKEFADRIIAQPGSKDYSRLSVLSQYLSTPRILFTVSRGDFTPVPKVDSALVEFKPNGKKYDKGFFDFIRVLFQFKNKSVKNALINGRRLWTGEKDKRKLKPILEGLSDRKIVTLSVRELKREYDLFRRNNLSF